MQRASGVSSLPCCFFAASFTVSPLPVWAATTVDILKPLQELAVPIMALMKCSEQCEIQSVLKCLGENKVPFLAKTPMFEEFRQGVCLISCANKQGAAPKDSRVSNPANTGSDAGGGSLCRQTPPGLRDRSKGCLLCLSSLCWQSGTWTC